MAHPSTKTTLARLGARPRRSMGQNFLQDPALALWMAEALAITPEDTVVEIGPGTGAVTEHLVGRGRKLLLVEKDAKLAAHQRETFAGDERVEVIEADAAGLDLRPFFKLGPLKVLGNLPYSVGTTIMAQWLENPSPVGHAIFMLQKEVCERVVARPCSGDYGQLTVRLQARWTVDIIKQVPPTVFHPRPKVDSAILSLRPRDRRELPVFDETLFARLVRQGFSQRRKQLKNLLPQGPLSWDDLIAVLGVPPTVRAEELSVAQWIELARRHDPHPLMDTAQSADELFDVVDDDDRVTGRATRAEVHARGLKHRAVHVFAFRRNGDLLLQKRSHLKDTCPGLWDSSAAGHLDAGEDYATCVTRELAEELGLDTFGEPPRRVARIAACAETGWEFVELHTVQTTGRVKFPAAEIECVHPFPPAEINAWTAARPQDFAPASSAVGANFNAFLRETRGIRGYFPAWTKPFFSRPSRTRRTSVRWPMRMPWGTVGSPDCGDMLRMWLKFSEKDGKKIIDRASFQSFGCQTALAVASLATEMLKGKTIDEARNLSAADLGAPSVPSPQ